MNPSGPVGCKVLIPSIPLRTIRNPLIIVWVRERFTVHKREVLPVTVQVKTTGSLGQAAPFPELDVN